MDEKLSQNEMILISFLHISVKQVVFNRRNVYDIKYQKIQIKRCLMLMNLLFSKFETYLLDEEHEIEKHQDQIEFAYEEKGNHEEYPPGFFSEL